jgi:hypothetical protein
MARHAVAIAPDQSVMVKAQAHLDLGAVLLASGRREEMQSEWHRAADLVATKGARLRRGATELVTEA